MEKSSPLVEVFILSYNRPEYILSTIDSVLQQTYPNLKIIVSDNSNKEDVEALIQNYKDRSQITYLRRRPSLPALTHFNTVFSEATTDYFMVFHDDDVLLPEAISKLVAAITKDPTLSAVGGNALLMNEKYLTQDIFDPNLKSDLKIKHPEELALHYLDSSKGHVPFPSYLYRRTEIENLEMNFKEGRKHSDVSFLVKTCQQGPLLWLQDSLMHYRRHGSNDSASLDIAAVFSLCRFLERNTKVSASTIKTYKMKSCILWLQQRYVQGPKEKPSWRYRTIIRATWTYALTHPHLLWSSFLKRFSKHFNT